MVKPLNVGLVYAECVKTVKVQSSPSGVRGDKVVANVAVPLILLVRVSLISSV